jgi:hypothetical protein
VAPKLQHREYRVSIYHNTGRGSEGSWFVHQPYTSDYTGLLSSKESLHLLYSSNKPPHTYWCIPCVLENFKIKVSVRISAITTEVTLKSLQVKSGIIPHIKLIPLLLPMVSFTATGKGILKFNRK